MAGTDGQTNAREKQEEHTVQIDKVGKGGWRKVIAACIGAGPDRRRESSKVGKWRYVLGNRDPQCSRRTHFTDLGKAHETGRHQADKKKKKSNWRRLLKIIGLAAWLWWAPNVAKPKPYPIPNTGCLHACERGKIPYEHLTDSMYSVHANVVH
jgi:hypothetical protein